jgi:hypothetical protein
MAKLAVKLIDITEKKAGMSAIIKAARDLAKEATDFRDKLHAVLCSAMNHAKVHGDTRIIDQVVNTACEPAMVRGMVDRWITHGEILNEDSKVIVKPFTNLRYREGREGDDVKRYRKPDKTALFIDLDAMLAMPYWEVPENLAMNRQILYDVDGLIVGLVKRLEKIAAKNQIKSEGPGSTAAKREHIVKLHEFVTNELKLEIPSPEPVAAAEATNPTEASTEEPTQPASEEAEQPAVETAQSEQAATTRRRIRKAA